RTCSNRGAASCIEGNRPSCQRPAATARPRELATQVGTPRTLCRASGITWKDDEAEGSEVGVCEFDGMGTAAANSLAEGSFELLRPRAKQGLECRICVDERAVALLHDGDPVERPVQQLELSLGPRGDTLRRTTPVHGLMIPCGPAAGELTLEPSRKAAPRSSAGEERCWARTTCRYRCPPTT